ncbi:MAG: protocatechuate 3,4-dioxygenase [Bordetella sp. SCN 67-23]|nr:protocatechuate 3,4-dioxygenase [Variovorax sp.]MBN9478536.1 protocatechuate 3,4-dioxygenase [Burkholderiales bacterium]ODS69252.1 MAG: protocatechuate 3,4-dioxygenase [Bordetella sp. SCN 67-23]OJW86998.1 MAG: protocatechuate 3,4-dioxygenase [Burkholderiales bacterium 67-32]
MNPQLEGIEQIPGTYAFDLRISNRTLKINRFFWNMIGADWRARFVADEEGTMDAAGLTEEEKALVRARDWLGLVQHGVNFFVLEKFGRVVKKTNLEIYAIMRGESFEEFMKTRLVPDAR